MRIIHNILGKTQECFAEIRKIGLIDNFASYCLSIGKKTTGKERKNRNNRQILPIQVIIFFLFYPNHPIETAIFRLRDLKIAVLIGSV